MREHEMKEKENTRRASWGAGGSDPSPGDGSEERIL